MSETIYIRNQYDPTNQEMREMGNYFGCELSLSSTYDVNGDCVSEIDVIVDFVM
jgi:hypothetical protein